MGPGYSGFLEIQVGHILDHVISMQECINNICMFAKAAKLLWNLAYNRWSAVRSNKHILAMQYFNSFLFYFEM